jgi:hypothetical protein
MATKQMNISFQVQNTLESTNTVTITLGGTTVYTGTLPETGPVIIGGDSNPVTNITFDIDVPVLTSVGNFYSTLAFSAAVTGATVQIEQIATNYNLSRNNTGTAEAPQWVLVAGNNTEFALTNIVSQPLWNGQADLNRYNIEYNNGPTIFGPGQVLIFNGETVAFNLAVANFNNTVPIGPLVP